MSKTRQAKYEARYGSAIAGAVQASILDVLEAGRSGDKVEVARQRARHRMFMQSLPRKR